MSKSPNIFKKPNKFKQWVNNKGKWVLISTGIFLGLGLICLILGFGFGYGWDYVAQWFTSPYAYFVYAFLALFAFLAVWLVYREKMKE